MSDLITQLKNRPHHAYCFVGSKVSHETLVGDIEKVFGVSAKNYSDFFDKSYGTFTIDDARHLKSVSENMPVGGPIKIFLISVNNITSEAQNALLKLFEEPSKYNKYFLIVPSTHLLLPTVKSRLAFIDLENSSPHHPSKEVQVFLQSSSAKRLDLIKKLLEDISKEKRSSEDSLQFLDTLEAVLYANKNRAETQETLRSIQLVRKYIYDRAPSVKMLLEYVALNMPT